VIEVIVGGEQSFAHGLSGVGGSYENGSASSIHLGE